MKAMALALVLAGCADARGDHSTVTNPRCVLLCWGDSKADTHIPPAPPPAPTPARPARR